jgi:hypothetical protein
MGRGRKPLGDRAMTDAERQRRRRQRLRQAQAELRQAEADSVTAEVSRNEEASEKKIDRLRNENKQLREHAKGWERLHRGEAATVSKLRAENSRLRGEMEAIQGVLARLGKSATLAGLGKPTITKLYREFSKKYHPDRGGSDAEMKVVNEIFAALRALVK